MRPPAHGHGSPFGQNGGVMAFRFGRMTYPAGEIQRVHKILELIDAGQLFDAIVFGQVPLGDLRGKGYNFRFGCVAGLFSSKKQSRKHQVQCT